MIDFNKFAKSVFVAGFTVGTDMNCGTIDDANESYIKSGLNERILAIESEINEIIKERCELAYNDGYHDGWTSGDING